MFVIDSLDIVVNYGFILALILMIVGIFVVLYVWISERAKTKDQDLSHRLEQWWHIILLRSCNIWIIRVLLISAALCGTLIGVFLLTDLISAATGNGLDFRLIPYHNYLPGSSGLAFVVFGVFIQLLLGNKGIAIPIGNGLSVSYDKGAVLAFHLDSKNPDIRLQESNIKAAINILRAKGHNHEIRIKSWLCVKRLPIDNAEVIKIRGLFQECSSFNVLMSRKIPHAWPTISSWKWWNHRALKGVTFIAAKVANTLSTIIYTCIRARKIRKAINRLPETRISLSTRKMIETIQLETGEAVTPIDVAPVTLTMFMNLGIKLPHIGDKFMGLDGGFTIRPR
ncbi:hypothetical protein [Pseudomonas baetica]|uniref:hypothetical protein n=1 Tax=Pseudomonas baetica TaxID=674054 RepID=UPI002870FF41|nr:hypothetical protein [Pseudomonas baetica]MDR9865897.1 hypothetical protein [Pseudomonas baetica]